MIRARRSAASISSAYSANGATKTMPFSLVSGSSASTRPSASGFAPIPLGRSASASATTTMIMISPSRHTLNSVSASAGQIVIVNAASTRWRAAGRNGARNRSTPPANSTNSTIEIRCSDRGSLPSSPNAAKFTRSISGGWMPSLPTFLNSPPKPSS